MVNNFTSIHNTNDHLSSQTTEHKNDNIRRWGPGPLMESQNLLSNNNTDIKKWLKNLHKFVSTQIDHILSQKPKTT